jgi:hypothetical protein
LAAGWAGRDRVAYARPYNRWKWDESQTWWVVPAPDQLAFRYSKIIVSSSPRLADSEALFVGLYVEKGIGAALAAAGYYPEEWVIRPTWRWHDIMGDLLAGAFAPAIADAARLLGVPVEIRIDAHVPVVRAAIQPPHDELAYRSVDGTVIDSLCEPILDTEPRFLRGAAQAQRLSQLAASLLNIPDSDTAWINFHIGVSLEKSGRSDVSALDAEQLSDKLLDPLAAWLT